MRTRPLLPQTVGLIPARRDSKGIRHKNLAPLNDQPLLTYTCKAALESKLLDRVVLSTNDRDAARVAMSLGVEVPFMRPDSLATDTAPMLQVVEHAVAELSKAGAEELTIVLLQPTSPLRKAAHIDQGLRLLEETDAGSVVSVVEVPHQFDPHSLFSIAPDGRLKRVLEHAPDKTRRQDARRLFARNGPAVLVTQARFVRSGNLYGPPVYAFPMPARYSIDINTADDMRIAEALLKLGTS